MNGHFRFLFHHFPFRSNGSVNSFKLGTVSMKSYTRWQALKWCKHANQLFTSALSSITSLLREISWNWKASRLLFLSKTLTTSEGMFKGKEQRVNETQVETNPEMTGKNRHESESIQKNRWTHVLVDWIGQLSVIVEDEPSTLPSLSQTNRSL